MIPGTSGFYSGCEREWFRPICEGDKFIYRVMVPLQNNLMNKVNLPGVSCNHTKNATTTVRVVN